MHSAITEIVYLIVVTVIPYVFARQFNPGENGTPVWLIVLIVCLILIAIGVLIACCFLYKSVRDCGKRIFKIKRRDESIMEQSTVFIQVEEDTRTRNKNQGDTAI